MLWTEEGVEEFWGFQTEGEGEPGSHLDVHVLANDSKCLCYKRWFFLVLLSCLNFRKSGWVLDFSTCPGVCGVKCNTSHFRWPTKKTEMRD